MKVKDKKKKVKSKITGVPKTYVIFRIGVEEFGVPVDQIVKVIKSVKITPLPNSPLYIEGVINQGGKVVVVINLEKRLGIKRDEKDLQEVFDQYIMIVEESKTEFFGIIADEVKGVLKILPKEIKDPSEALTLNLPENFIEGIALIEKRMIAIIDLVKIATHPDIKEVSNKDNKK